MTTLELQRRAYLRGYNDAAKNKDWVSIKDINGCHIPDNYKIQPTGYISCKKEGFCKLHRFVFYKNNSEGLSPDKWREKHHGKVIMHTCDNPSCINPLHLRIGTQIDNIKDRVKKGRSAYHESNGNNKLTTKDVEFIKYYHGKRTIRELSEFFGVCRETIQRIVLNKSWMPLPEPPQNDINDQARDVIEKSSGAIHGLSGK